MTILLSVRRMVASTGRAGTKRAGMARLRHITHRSRTRGFESGQCTAKRERGGGGEREAGVARRHQESSARKEDEGDLETDVTGRYRRYRCYITDVTGVTDEGDLETDVERRHADADGGDHREAFDVDQS